MKIKNICKAYDIKNGEKVHALKGVSFDLPSSGMVAILGRSGSGKTTLLNILSGLDRFDDGDIECFGKHMKDFSRKELDHYRNSCCGFVFQEYHLIPELDVGDNIALALQLQGQKGVSEKIRTVLQQVDLAGYEHRKIEELSGGQKQRVAIARALVKDPKIIFADEPTGALDSQTGESILQILKTVAKEKLVIMVTHDREFAERYADRIIELSDGTVIRDTNDSYRFTETDQEMEMRNPRLPVGTAMKIGCSNFKYHPVRLVSTILLSVIAFFLFGISLIASTVRYNDFIYDSLRANHVSSCILVKYENEMQDLFSSQDRAAVNENFQMNTVPVKSNAPELDGYSEQEDIFSSVLPDKIVSISEKDLEFLNLKYQGQLPSIGTEIAITDLLADMICGSEDPMRCIGKDLTLNGKKYIITAVIDTEKENSRFLQNALFVYDVDLFDEKENIIFDSPGQLYLNDSYSISISNIVKNTDSVKKYALGEEANGNYLPICTIPIILNNIPCSIAYHDAYYSTYGQLFDALIQNEPDGEDVQNQYLKVFDRIRNEFALNQWFRFSLRNPAYHFDSLIFIDGFYFQESPINENSSQKLILNDGSFDELRHIMEGQCDAIIVPVNSNLKDYLNRDSVIRVYNDLVSKLYSWENNISILKTISTVLTIVLAVFSSVLIVSFISQSLSDKTKTIGVLRAFGSNQFNIMKIFIWEGLMISCCVFLMSTVILFGACNALNLLFSEFMGFHISFFGLNVFVVFCLLLLTIIFSFIGCLIPIIKLTRLQPNEIIGSDI